MHKIIAFIVVLSSVSGAHAQQIPLLRDGAALPELVSSNDYPVRQLTAPPQAARAPSNVGQAPLDNPGVYAPSTMNENSFPIISDLRQMNF